MIDSIQTQVREARELKDALKLAEGVSEPLVVLNIDSNGVKGELWVADGKYICHGSVGDHAAGGLADIFQLLTIKDGRFDLKASTKARPDCQLEISIAELGSNEQGVIQKIKNVLWPTDDAQENTDDSAPFDSAITIDRPMSTFFSVLAKESPKEDAVVSMAESLTSLSAEFDAGQTIDETDMAAKRQDEYDRVNEVLGESKENFYKGEAVEDSVELTDLQKRILEISKEEGEDDDAFRQRNPDLSDTSFKPTEGVPEGEAAPPPLPAKSTQKEEDTGLAQKLKSKMAAESGGDTVDLIKREGLFSHEEVARLEEEGVKRKRRKRVPQEVIIGSAIGGILIPAAGFVLWHYNQSEQLESYSQQHEAESLAMGAVEEKTMTTKPQEPFRLPSGGSGNAAPPPRALTAAEEEALPTGKSMPPYNFQRSSVVVNLSQQEMEAAHADQVRGDKLLSEGKPEEAVEVYQRALKKYAGYMPLRISTVRACINARRYQTARAMAMQGLSLCNNESDYRTLYAMLQEIP